MYYVGMYVFVCLLHYGLCVCYSLCVCAFVAYYDDTFITLIMVCVCLQGDWADQFERMRLSEADSGGGGADAWAEQFERIMQKPEDQWAAEFDSLQASQGICMHIEENAHTRTCMFKKRKISRREYIVYLWFFTLFFPWGFRRRVGIAGLVRIRTEQSLCQSRGALSTRPGAAPEGYDDLMIFTYTHALINSTPSPLPPLFF